MAHKAGMPVYLYDSMHEDATWKATPIFGGYRQRKGGHIFGLAFYHSDDLHLSSSSSITAQWTQLGST
jgi:hypothetical protein